ncbi:MAG: hypothetical protein KDA84_21790 [Planctomycetaceae bacterium]|nr:hypothetical protein [Planctomycetaceae bacterium]
MRISIRKTIFGAMLLSLAPILAPSLTPAAVEAPEPLLTPLPSATNNVEKAPSVQLPFEEAAIDVPMPTEETAHFGYYGGYGFRSYYRPGFSLSIGYNRFPYRSFGLSYYRPYYRGYSFYRPSYYYPGSYYSYSFRPSYYGVSYYRPSYYSSYYYRPFYTPTFSASYYQTSFYGPALYGGYGYGAYGCGPFGY